MQPQPQASASDVKLDRLLTLAEQTSTRLGSLETRVTALEGRGSSGGPPPGAAATPPAMPAGMDVPGLLFAKCAACHEAKVSAKLGKRFTLFVVAGDRVDMAKLDAAGKLVQLTPTDLRKMERVLADNSMPPPEDIDKKPVPGLTPAERAEAVKFLQAALAAGPR